MLDKGGGGAGEALSKAGLACSGHAPAVFNTVRVRCVDRVVFVS